MRRSAINRVAIIGAGASGAAAATALQAEGCFSEIKVFERRSSPGGTWIYDPVPNEVPLRPGSLPPDLDLPLAVPKDLPTTLLSQEHISPYTTTPIYEHLTTNVPDVAMAFTDSRFAYGPFVPHYVPKQYIENYFSLHRIDDYLSLNTTLERLQLLPGHRWQLVLRRHDAVLREDYWWREEFDAVILANGHYAVPYMPNVPGLREYIQAFPKRIEHSKTYRRSEHYASQSVLIIGNSASGYDIADILRRSGHIKLPLYVSRRSKGRLDGEHPPQDTIWKPVITSYNMDGSITFADGTTHPGFDKIIYCTGYKPSYPFWDEQNNGRPLFDYVANHLIRNYQHTFLQDFPTLGIIGLPRVLAFRSFEYQSIALARYWASRNPRPLPSIAEQQRWLDTRIACVKAKNQPFHHIEWAAGETMEWFSFLYEFAGLPRLTGEGRFPPVMDRETKWALDNIKKYWAEHYKGIVGEK